jgi:hypothetical protein
VTGVDGGADEKVSVNFHPTARDTPTSALVDMAITFETLPSMAAQKSNFGRIFWVNCRLGGAALSAMARII